MGSFGFVIMTFWISILTDSFSQTGIEGTLIPLTYSFQATLQLCGMKSPVRIVAHFSNLWPYSTASILQRLALTILNY